MSAKGQKNHYKFSDWLVKQTTKKFLLLLTLVIAIIVLSFSTRKIFSSESKTTKLGFEDIGELVTQVAYCSEVNVTDVSRDLFGVEIPFTQSKYIYSYDIEIKAGFDFQKIRYTVNDNTIKVTLSNPYIISSDLKEDTFKVYHESESIFRTIHIDEINESLKSLKEQAIKNAINNGLFDNAKINAERLLTAFFSGEYDMEKYEIQFRYEQD